MKKKYYIVFLVLYIMAFFIDRYLTAKREHSLEYNSAERVATIITIDVAIGRGGVGVMYKFEANGDTIYGSLNVPKGNNFYKPFHLDKGKDIGRKFIVKYLPNDPEINVILLDREVK